MKFLKNKYTKWYYQIINRARKRGQPDEYFERHHVIPRCMKGTNKWWNIVNLTYKEHWVVHKLLLKMTKGVALRKMCIAFGALRMQRSGRKLLNSRQFAFAREQHRLGILGSKRTEEQLKRMALTRRVGSDHPMYGKKHSIETIVKMKVSNTGSKNGFYGKSHTNELKVRMSEIKKGKHAGELNPMYGKKHSESVRKVISEKGKGRIWREESRLKSSESHKGSKNSFYGKRHSEEALRAMSADKFKHGKYSKLFPLPTNKCYCGCGSETSPGKRLIRGHWGRLSPSKRLEFNNPLEIEGKI